MKTADEVTIVFLACFHSMFKELVFKLPDDNGSKLGEPAQNLTQEAVRFAIHPAKDRPMIAMATVNHGDLKILVCHFCVLCEG